MKEKEYLIQGINKGEVEDCITAIGEDSLADKLKGSWITWFDSVRVFDISNQLSPILIG